MEIFHLLVDAGACVNKLAGDEMPPLLCHLCMNSFVKHLPRPPKGSKKWNPPNMNPLLHWGNWGIMRGFHFLDPSGGLGKEEFFDKRKCFQ